MKEFRKNEQGFFICEECGQTYKIIGSLARHIKQKHNSEQYMIKWIREADDGKCKICGKETQFQNFVRFYQKTCSKECNFKLRSKNMSSNERQEKIKKTNLKKYGVEYPMQSSILLKQMNNISLEKYGVSNVFQSEIIKEKCKQTKLKKYGDEKFKNWKKHKQTNLKKYGCEWALSNKEIREKSKNTMKLKYGVEHQSQNENIHKKQMFTGKRIKKYKDTDIWYQGTFELDFLEKYFNKFEIRKAHSIKYKFNNKNKYYHPDFYIPFLNLIVEIKNSYYAKRDKNVINFKKKAAISYGYKYIMIIDKNYKEFENLIN